MSQNTPVSALLENFVPSYIKYSVAEIELTRFHDLFAPIRQAGKIMLWKVTLSLPMNWYKSTFRLLFHHF